MISMTLSELATVCAGTWDGGHLRFAGLSTDSRSIEIGQLFCALSGPSFDGNSFVKAAADAGAVAALTTRADPALPCVVVADTLAALGALGSHWRSRFDVDVVGITGSNGKTTVKEMTARIAAEEAPVLATRGNLNNEIGVPLTLVRLAGRHRRMVVEMGANHPGEIARLAAMGRPRIGVITQIAPAHLEGFGSIQGVARAKGELFAALPGDGIAICPDHCAHQALWRELAPGRTLLRFGFDPCADVQVGYRTRTQGEELDLATPRGRIRFLLPLHGRHNVVNAAAAAAAAVAMGLECEHIAGGLSRMQPLQGRLAPLAGRAGVRILDDSYNANPQSLRAALEVLSASDAPRWLVLGDMAELGPCSEQLHREAGRLARDAHVQRLWCTGEQTRASADCFGEGARHFEDTDGLIDALSSALQGGATVLIKGSRSAGMERVVKALAEVSPCC